DSFEIQGVPDGLPPTLLVQFERSDLSLVLSPPVASEPAAESRAGAIDVPHPHPLRSQGTVRMSLREAADVRLVLVDALGREVVVLREAPMAAGARTVQLDAQDLAPGVYLLVLDADGHRATRPVVVAR
ncbi:MAG: T9SS type A sorting domain-containing protein, partial [Bacteroidota bacterium]